ncbi:MAG: alpha/beta hydrolase family protein [Candidatus Hodarchaeales archaeon]|jgi:esterase/lipase
MDDLEFGIIKMDQDQYPLFFVHKKGANPQDIRNIVLHFHGFTGGPKEEFTKVHQHFAEQGFMVISFNYPGLWNAPGLFIPEEVMICCTNVIEFLMIKYQQKKLFVYAESFGGILSLAAIKKVLSKNKKIQIEAMAFRAPLPSLKPLALTQNGAWKRFTFEEVIGFVQQAEEDQTFLRTEKEKWTHIENAKEFCVSSALIELDKSLPKLVIVGENDGILFADEVITTYRDYAQIELFKNLPHNDIPDDKFVEMVNKIVDFYLKPNQEQFREEM